MDGVDEADEVVGTDELGRDEVGKSGEMDPVGFRVGSDEPEPLFGDDECDDEVGVTEDEAFAEVHHRVYVASSGPRQGHHVAVSEWLRFSWIHRDEKK